MAQIVTLMEWLAIVGLSFDAIGAIGVLAPRLPWITRFLDQLWPFNKIEAAKARLYHSGQLTKQDPGFPQIATAIEYGSGWTNHPGETLEQGGKNEIRIEVDGETRTFQDTGYELVEINRVSDPDAYPELENLQGRPPVSRSKFTLHYQPKVLRTAGLEHIVSHPRLCAESPQGQLPRQIEQHKERIAFRTGALLLFTGFSLQIAAAMTAPF